MGQLDYLSNLCKVNNEEAINKLINSIRGYLFSGLKDENPKIRSKFAQLLSAMYTDVGYNRPVLENLTLTFIFDECIPANLFESNPCTGLQFSPVHWPKSLYTPKKLFYSSRETLYA